MGHDMPWGNEQACVHPLPRSLWHHLKSAHPLAYCCPQSITEVPRLVHSE